jgi:GH18 family chitinase
MVANQPNDVQKVSLPIGTSGKTALPGKCTQQPGTLAWFEIQSLIKDPTTNAVSDTNGASALLPNNQWVGYDDLSTVKTKVNLIKELGLGGAMMWSVDFDTNDFIFTKTVRNTLYMS